MARRCAHDDHRPVLIWRDWSNRVGSANAVDKRLSPLLFNLAFISLTLQKTRKAANNWSKASFCVPFLKWKRDRY
jgi:hypothetical protein